VNCHRGSDKLLTVFLIIKHHMITDQVISMIVSAGVKSELWHGKVRRSFPIQLLIIHIMLLVRVTKVCCFPLVGVKSVWKKMHRL
jgi:hypothetical protein